MKYTVTAYAGENEYSVTVNCRYDAKIETLYRKCMNEVSYPLFKKGVLSHNATWRGEKPNIWINGAVGSVWFVNPFINVSIVAENGCVIAQ